jgi:phospholipid/cholesterol/gamma-HCH transport system permease protein
MQDDALLTFSQSDGFLQARASGSWTCDNAGMLEANLARLAEAGAGADRVAVDMAEVIRFDTFGAWLLERLRRDFATRSRPLQVVRLSAGHRSLLDEMAALNRTDALALPDARRHWLPDATFLFAALRRELASFLVMLGALISASARAIRQPRGFRLTSTVHQFERVAWQAVPIILMITLLIGAIIAQQGFFQFRRFGADLYVVNMIGFLIMREIGVLLVAIMVAGRTGSSYTAELGSMKMREEIDALTTMGFDPVAILVLPRVLVLTIALPALAFVGSLAALLGAGLVAVFYAGLNPDLYVQQLREAISLDHFQVGLIKAPFIGAVIGIIACNEGLQVRGSAASLGEHTTRSVVKSIFMIIVLDGMFALFFSAIGM